MVVGENVWQGRHVFLTGHTGFKGSWLALDLARRGAKVFGFALPPVEQGIFRSAKVADVVAGSIYGDVRDPDAVRQALVTSEASVVIHMAAQPLVRLSYDDPVGTYATNVMGTVHLLEAVRHQPSVRAVVVVTSDKCYENREWVWAYRENEAMGGYDPYSNSKGCAELVTSAFRQSFFGNNGLAKIASGRAGNVIGGGDWSADRLVPDLVRTFAAGEVTLIRNPAAIRPWQHVLDPLSGYVALAECLLSEENEESDSGWNFGPDSDSERNVGQVVEAISLAWGEGARWCLDERAHPHEAHYLKLDSSKAKRWLGWTPVWDFAQAIDQTVSWYLAERAGEDMQAYSLGQIDTYAAHQRFAGDKRAGS